MKKNTLIDGSDVDSACSAEAAKDLNCEPIFLYNLVDFYADTKSKIVKYRNYETNTQSLTAIIKTLKKNNIADIAT